MCREDPAAAPSNLLDDDPPTLMPYSNLLQFNLTNRSRLNKPLLLVGIQCVPLYSLIIGPFFLESVAVAVTAEEITHGPSVKYISAER